MYEAFELIAEMILDLLMVTGVVSFGLFLCAVTVVALNSPAPAPATVAVAKAGTCTGKAALLAAKFRTIGGVSVHCE